MPRRGFFRGGGGDKKSSKKQHKLQQKHAQQQQQQSLLRQHAQQKRLSTSQASSASASASVSANNDQEPPLGLGGPRRTPPVRQDDPRAGGGGVRFLPGSGSTSSKSSPPPRQPQGAPLDAGAHHQAVVHGGRVERIPQNDQHQQPQWHQQPQQHHQQHQQHQQHQYLYHSQYQSQPHMLNQMHPGHQTQTQYGENSAGAGGHYTPLLHQHQQQGTPPFAGQSHPQQPHGQSPRQQQQAPPQLLAHQQLRQHQATHAPPPPPAPSVPSAAATNAPPTVDEAIEEMWRCDTDDFRSASHAVQMLRLAIVAEWEGQRMAEAAEREEGGGGPGGLSPSRQTSYDPSDTFLSLQGATLRFHARFESMKAERDAANLEQKRISRPVGEEKSAAADSRTVHTNSSQSQSLNGVEWELAEQAAWEVWEESVRASAALTHSCVGPAWRFQLRVRRRLIRETELRLLHQPHLRYVPADGMSVGGSSAGGTSLASSLVSADVSNLSNPQSSGRPIVRGSRSATHRLPPPPVGPIWRPPVDVLELLSCPIPEVLPAAMIRFAASVVETSIPPLRHADTRIFWDEDQADTPASPPGGGVGVGGGDGSEALLTSLGMHLHDERRWLRRRKRLGDTQRDLAFGLFCGGNESEEDAGHDPAVDAEDDSKVTWSIPGAHTPVSVMIHSWLETCQCGFPIPRDIEDGNIPFYIDKVSPVPPIDTTTSEITDGDINESSKRGPLPTEIGFVAPLAVPNEGHPVNIGESPNHRSSEGRDQGETRREDLNVRKFSLWGELVDLSRVDWWYTLRVLRDCSDLVSAGWRPPPSGRIGEGIVLSLITIAEKGISHLSEDSNIRQEMPEEQIRKERLVACSCASESLVAIKTLATRDVIPHASLRPLAISLCQLISAAETTIDSVSSGDSEEVEEDTALFEKEILTQRMFVASSSAELLWVLLSNEETSCPTTDALLDAMDMDLHVEITDENYASVEECVMIANGAIRALSAAMWGDPPSVKGVPLLRFFWQPVIDLLGKVAGSFFQSHNSTQATFDIGGHQTSVVMVDHREVHFKNPFLKMILEIVLALQRLVDSEMVYGTGDLCATEWESFVRAIDIGISPWLACFSTGSGSLTQEIRIEALQIVSQIGSFLVKCSQTEHGSHLIVDDDARNYLHLFLLRKVAPLLHLRDSLSKPAHPVLVGDDATALALAVIQSWCVVRFLPFKEGDWAKRASDLLAEAFVIPELQPIKGHRYIGGYLHHPFVRLEALKSLVNDDSTDIDHLSATRDSDSVSTSGISTITPVSLKSGNIPPAFSLFSLTKNMRELHLVLVNSVILPRLEEILSITMPTLQTTECQPSPRVISLPAAECFDIIEKEFLLRRFAVKILGGLFRSRTGEGEKRHHFIDLLQKVAVSTPYGMRKWVRRREQELGEGSKNAAAAAVDSISVSEFLKGEEMNLRLEAIRQIETCLGAPFSSLPHTHGNVPEILKSICDTAKYYSLEYEEDEIYAMCRTERLLMTLASMLPLSRLSCARNGQAILMSRQLHHRNIPEDILSVISVDEWLHNINPMILNETLPIVCEENEEKDYPGDMAPFVWVKQYHARGESKMSSSKQTRKRQTHRSSSGPMNGKQGTVVDFENVAATIKVVLNAVSRGIPCVHDEGRDTVFDRTISSTSVATIPTIVSTICYDLISSFLSHGMAFPCMDDLLWLDLNVSNSVDENELISRSEAVSVFAGLLGHIIVSHIGDEEKNHLLGRRICDVLVTLSMSNYHKVVQHACCGLISILSALRHSFERRMAKTSSRVSSHSPASYDAEISDCLTSFIDHVCDVLRTKGSRSELALIPLIDAMREAFALSVSSHIFELPMSLRRRAFLMLFQPTRDQWEVQVVAFQCAVAIINAMTPQEASLMMFFAIGPKKDVKLPNRKRIQPLLLDLLRSRLAASRLLKTSAASAESHFKPSRVHERLAREALSLALFPVDLDDLGSPKVSAWKCGNAILTLRLGCKDSFYRGWVEIVVRSPCSRIRRLVKWRKECVTEHPESFLPFYEQLRPTESIKCGDVNTRAADRNVPTRFVRSEESSRVIERFDSLFPPAESLVDVASLRKNEVDLIVKTESGHQKKPSRRKSKSFVGGNQVGQTGLKRTLSDSHLKSISVPHRAEMPPRKRSVYSWMQWATGRQSIDVDLILELEALGFSRPVLGVPAMKVITTNSYTDLFVHEQMKPFSVGPNFNRALSILDRVTPFQTHRIALFYGGPFSTKRNARSAKADSKSNDGDKFLTATQASADFWQFANSLGDLVPIRHCKYFSGGMDTSESLSDGSFAMVWFGCQGGNFETNDPLLVDSMVFFHTVTLMPDRLTNRKRHVGNDVVHIVYGLDIDTLDVDHERMAISGHFGFITVYVIPLVHVPLFKVSVHLKAGLDESICRALDHLVGSWLISRRVGAHFVRNLAMQADVICQSMIEDKLGLVLNTEDRNDRITDTERHMG